MNQKQLYTLLLNKLSSHTIPPHVRKADPRVLRSTARQLAQEVASAMGTKPRAQVTHVSASAKKYD